MYLITENIDKINGVRSVIILFSSFQSDLSNIKKNIFCNNIYFIWIILMDDADIEAGIFKLCIGS